jgi:hypothetical protein
MAIVVIRTADLDRRETDSTGKTLNRSKLIITCIRVQNRMLLSPETTTIRNVALLSFSDNEGCSHDARLSVCAKFSGGIHAG